MFSESRRSLEVVGDGQVWGGAMELEDAVVVICSRTSL